MSSSSQTPLTYAAAGVSIDAGNELVERIKPHARATKRPGVLGGIGGFGALFDIKALNMKDPLLIATTDGVGTKVKIAQAANRHTTIGIDLVAMCVNDLVVQGGQPLFFLDYYATGKLSVTAAEEVIAGIAEGCRQAGAALTGGETAEMPGVYDEGEYDLAGFAVGAVERFSLLPKMDNFIPGDVILGLASSGVHSNGFSLVRKVMEREGLSYDAPAPFAPGKSFADVWLEPTKIYVKSCLAAIATGAVKGLAHITGGGLPENLPRVLPAQMQAQIDLNSWEVPAIFQWLKEKGNIPQEDFYRTFNAGIGMVLVVAAHKADAVTALLTEHGETVHRIGTMAMLPEGAPRVVMK